MTKKRKTKYAKFIPQRPGDHIMITVAHYWGRGPTMEAAEEALRATGGGNYRTQPHVVYSVHPETFCHPVTGSLVSPAGVSPIKLITAVSIH